MQQLWAPWRGDFISGEKPPGCVFCEAPKAEDLKAMLVAHKGEHCFVILNRYPYTNGHLMVVPYRHLADFTAATPEEGAEMFALIQRCVSALRSIMSPHAFNVGANLGREAGAGIDQHLHFHVVPRWNGDTNFMPVLGDTRVISEHLEVTFDRIAMALSSSGL